MNSEISTDRPPFRAGDWIEISTGQPLPGAPIGVLISAQAAAAPNRPAVTVDGGTYTFAEFDGLANRRARDLLKRGVNQGATVLLSMPNRVEYLECAFALWKIGAVPCPVSHQLPAKEFNAILDLSGARHVIGMCSLPIEPPVLYDVDVPLADSIDASPLPPAVSTPGRIANSGGSTGRPKLIVDPFPSSWTSDKEGCRRGPRLTLINPAPLYHSAPFATMTMAMAQGSHILCMERFDPHEWLRLVEQWQVDYVYMVPTMMARIARLPSVETQNIDLSSIQTLVHMAAPCHPEVKRWWIERIGGDRVWEVYGGAERVGVTRIGGAEWLAHPGSVGATVPGQEILITGPDGELLPAGEIGEIRFRKTTGVGSSYAYIGSETRIKGDTDSFGDMGWLDADGYLYIADRRTDMILVGGANVYPAEIEAVVEAQAGVRCCAVIGLPDHDLGNRVHAIVEMEPDAIVPSADAMLTTIRGRLAGAKRPSSVEFVNEPIRDEAGKVRRSALRDARVN